jgi:ketosteroid isomerase-like protein
MFFKFLILFITLLAGIFTACRHHANVDETQNVNKVIYTLIKADNNADIKTVLKSYTDSIEFYPAGRDFSKGIKNIQASYEKLFKENKLSIATQINETKIFGSEAIVTGINVGSRTTLSDSSVNQINDKYIATLIRDSTGEWKIDKLIWGINH